MSQEIDLSAFPILRLDQIGLLDDKTLKRALDDITAMMSESNFSQQKMAKYIRKQYDSMLFEYNERQAALRVEKLLSGAIEALHQSYSPKKHEQSIPSEVNSSDASKKRIDDLAQEGFLVSKKLVLRDSFVESNPRKNNVSNSNSSPSLEMEKLSISTKEPTLQRFQTQSAPGTASSSIKPNLNDLVVAGNENAVSDAAQHGNTGIAMDERSTTPRSTSNKTPRVRKHESPAGEENQPSKKSLEIVYRNFGNEFIVAATERKKRFIPKKDPVESMEQRKERERLERRKIAMERLVKRREDQENRKLQLREQRRQEKLRKLRKEKGDDSDSGSESVSGGDDDLGLKVDESLVPAMQAVLEEEKQRTFVVKLAPGQRPKAKKNSSQTSLQNRPAFGRNVSASKKEVVVSSTNASSSSLSSKPPLPSVVKQKSKAPNSMGNNLPSSTTRSDKDEENTHDQYIDQECAESEQDIDESEANNEKTEGPVDTAIEDGNQDDTNSSSDKQDIEINGNDDSDDNNITDVDNKLDENEDTTVDKEENNENSNAAYVPDNIFSSKNLSALATIRKLKEAKQNKSLSYDPDDSVPGVPSVEEIVQKAMAAVDRVATPHLLSRPSTSIKSTFNHSHEVVEATNRSEDPSWSFDDLLPLLLAALHVQRVVHAAEVDLLQVMGDTVMFNFGPDDLPGLRALQLVQHRPPGVLKSSPGIVVNNANFREFRVSLEEYHNRIYSEENADIFDYRSMKRREIPLGLILLAITSHRILFGKVAIDTVQDFNQAWLAAIQSFDNQASRAASEGQESAYFSLVQVCGNGYAICKKLEVLLENYFSSLWMDSPTNRSLHVREDQEFVIKSTKMSRNFSARRKIAVDSGQFKEFLPMEDSKSIATGRPRRDSQDSLLEFLQVSQQKIKVDPPSLPVTVSIVPAIESNEESSLSVKIDALKQENTADLNYEEVPPPSSAAFSILSRSNPPSRPTTASSAFLLPAGSYAQPLATVYSSGNNLIGKEKENPSVVQQYAEEAQNRNKRPMSGRRSAAAAKFRSDYMGTSHAETPPVENVIDDKLKTQRQKIAEYAQSLKAGDMFPVTDNLPENTTKDITITSAHSGTDAEGKKLISFSQMEEELAAADAALAFVLQQQNPPSLPNDRKISTNSSKVSGSLKSAPQSKKHSGNSTSKRTNELQESQSSKSSKLSTKHQDPPAQRRKPRRNQLLTSSENIEDESSVTLGTSVLASGEKPPLIEYYPQFAMIFPMAYSQTLQVRDDMGYARVILESMQVQAKVYEEWVEVMRDYSTVFCHNTHNNMADTDDTDDDSDSNIQVKASSSKRPKRVRPALSNDNVDTNNGNKNDDDINSSEVESKRRSAAVYKGGNRALHYRVKSSRSEVFNIVCDVFQSSLPQWENLPAGLGLGLSWNLLWTWSKPRINHSHLLIWQKVNHFEESRQLTRKDFLKKNLQRYTDMPHSMAKEFEIMPLTFLLPHEYNAFVSAFTSLESQKVSDSNNKASPAQPLNYWILKPVGLSRGRGISLIRDLGDLTYAQASVIQKYVENPLCLQQYKFDLRIYVVVTSFKPLEAFIYREGFARVSLEAYSTQAKDMDNLFIHLTNSSIQKKHTSGPSKDNPVQMGQDSGAEVEVGGSKISLLGNHGLWKRLEEYSQGSINSEEIWRAICTLIVKSLVVVDDKIPHQPNCFELFGYDVLIDSNLRPWLIEVNASPSLARENALDHRVKNTLIKDIIELLNVAPYDRAALARVMRKRLNNIAKQRHVHGRNDADLEQDLQDILGDYRPRRIGEMPEKMGQFERLAPDTPYFQQVLKLKKKLFKDA